MVKVMAEMHSADGDVYEGEFKDGKSHGIYTYADGGVYDEESKDGIFNGKGNMTYTNDDVYDGEFKDRKCMAKER